MLAMASKGYKMSYMFRDLYEVVEQRRIAREEGSYTAYLFESGLDKILKKVGEETAETIIAAKNLRSGEEDGSGDRNAFINETGDLLYHLTVMLCELGVRPEEVEHVLRERMKKTGNLKQFHESDKDT